MKNIEEKLVALLPKGFCAPQIGLLARETGDPSTTIHYNVKRMEAEGKIAAYKAALNYQKPDFRKLA